MKLQSQKNTHDIQQFLVLAYGDYLAARLLLLNDLLPQSIQQAATAVEKLFKALVLIKGNRCKGHLEKNLTNNVKNKYPELYANLNEDFIKFLRKGYKLRYHDDKGTKYTLVINQFRTLAELDILMHKVNLGFTVKSEDSNQNTPYQQGLEQKDLLLFKDNHILNKIPLLQYFQRENRVFEISFENGTSVISAQYSTVAVNANGSFLKPVDLSTSKSNMILTLG